MRRFATRCVKACVNYMSHKSTSVKKKEMSSSTASLSPIISPASRPPITGSTTFLDHMSDLDITVEPQYLRLTGIICTIGPACKDVATLEKMIESGMNIARLNFSHGSHEYHAESIKNIRQAAKNYGKKIGRSNPLAIALDTKGAEIRTGCLEGVMKMINYISHRCSTTYFTFSSMMSDNYIQGSSAEIHLHKGDTITVTTDEQYSKKGNKDIIFVDYLNITKVLKIGDKIFVDRGVVALVCTKILGNSVTCTVENGGLLGSSKEVNLPGTETDLPTVSEKDKRDLRFGAEQGVDIVFASFTRNADEVQQVRQVLGKDSPIRVVAKIEDKQGVQNVEEIIQAADGILIARGDLGIQISLQKVFLAQKFIIACCNKAGKPIVIATQLLESMVDKPRPTRAESSDVANAVLDGADCVQLSGETANGRYPVECVQTMATICKQAEAAVWQKQIFLGLTRNIIPPVEFPHTIAIAAVEASVNSLASAIIVVTRGGRSAQLISKYRPRCPIIAVTDNAQVSRQLHLYRAIMPLHYEGESSDDWIEYVNLRVKYGILFGESHGFIKSKDLIVVVSGWKSGPGFTNTLALLLAD